MKMFCLRRFQQLFHAENLQNISGKSFSKITSANDSFFITTPIFYVNGDPHLGHFYTAAIADALSRYKNLATGCDVIFSTGTDEHGLKIQQAAAKGNELPNSYANRMSKKFMELCDKGNIQYTQFIRTTSEQHQVAVKTFWETLMSRGYIYKGIYEGWYCVSDETFLTESQVTENSLPNGKSEMVSLESNNLVEWISEDNYIFKLSSFKDDLIHWIKKDVIKPRIFTTKILNLIEDLEDLSVSRPVSRLNWGVSVPNDPDHTVYVWLDALINYLTVVGYPNKPIYKWPPDCQVIGKDILKFHAIYWPAFLIAANLEPPRNILCHSHWLAKNEKMSKSKGNVVDPIPRMNKFSVDGFRYLLLSRGVPKSDVSYNDVTSREKLNNELMGVTGNLVQRVTTLNLNKKREFPKCHPNLFNAACGEDGQEIVRRVSVLPELVEKHFSEYEIYKAIQDIINCLRMINIFLQTQKPWTNKDNPSKESETETVLYTCMETIRICAILLQPIIPEISSKILWRLGIPENERLIKGLKCFTAVTSNEPAIHEGRKLPSDTMVIFPKIL
ncbi:Methionine--tRNA ligase, mitochondrial [Nymphon striatum]|nr:Methionine--tRNA ligase, mitochondrial [Nymphon striatum]